jgi:arsenate reductase-like glutaredoxin family protein
VETKESALSREHLTKIISNHSGDEFLLKTQGDLARNTPAICQLHEMLDERLLKKLVKHSHAAIRLKALEIL